MMIMDEDGTDCGVRGSITFDGFSDGQCFKHIFGVIIGGYHCQTI